MKQIILAILIFGNFSLFSQQAINTIGGVDNYMSMDTVKYDVTFSVKKSKNKANIVQSVVDEFGNTITTNFATLDTGAARQFIDQNLAYQDSIAFYIDQEFRNIEQRHEQLRNEIDWLIDQKKALRKRYVIANKTRKQLTKLKI